MSHFTGTITAEQVRHSRSELPLGTRIAWKDVTGDTYRGQVVGYGSSAYNVLVLVDPEYMGRVAAPVLEVPAFPIRRDAALLVSVLNC